MEDEFGVAYQQTADEKDLEYAFFGIFDGHGGREAALFAKVNLGSLTFNSSPSRPPFSFSFSSPSPSPLPFTSSPLLPSLTLSSLLVLFLPAPHLSSCPLTSLPFVLKIFLSHPLLLLSSLPHPLLPRSSSLSSFLPHPPSSLSTGSINSTLGDSLTPMCPVTTDTDSLFIPGTLDGLHRETERVLGRGRRVCAEGDSRGFPAHSLRDVERAGEMAQDCQWTTKHCWHYSVHCVHQVTGSCHINYWKFGGLWTHFPSSCRGHVRTLWAAGYVCFNLIAPYRYFQNFRGIFIVFNIKKILES